MGLSMGEIILIIAVIVLLFGASKLPELARSMGKAVNEFKKGVKEGADGDEKTDNEPKAKKVKKSKALKKKK